MWVLLVLTMIAGQPGKLEYAFGTHGQCVAVKEKLENLNLEIHTYSVCYYLAPTENV